MLHLAMATTTLIRQHRRLRRLVSSMMMTANDPSYKLQTFSNQSDKALDD
jgi:hypothetical protein